MGRRRITFTLDSWQQPLARFFLLSLARKAHLAHGFSKVEAGTLTEGSREECLRIDAPLAEE